MVAYSLIFAIILTLLCVFEFCVNLIVARAIVSARLWKQNSTYALSFGNLLNDQFLLLCHLIYLVPASFLQSFLSEDGPAGLFPSIMNWGLLAGWYVTSFTLAFIALTRFSVIVLNWSNLSFWVAAYAMVAIYSVSWTMSVVAQFVFPCCQMVMHPFNYGYGYVEIGNLTNTSNSYFDFPLNNAVSAITLGCYTMIILKLIYMRQRHGSKNGQLKGAKEYTYALQFCAISMFYVFNWVSTRVNGMIFGDNLEWYSCGAYFLIFNCGANGVIYLWRNREVRRVIFGSPTDRSKLRTLSVAAQSSTTKRDSTT